ncbi:MAG: DUF262 domain-containing HNH endonuclease family protein [Muribaculaceae bacterium]|nr:DUF262 domain-containing HNH endonuclease family protein [Muribaculaceae bacterium]
MANTSKYEFIDLTVEKCFSNFFVVPDYQREYVWEADKQVEQLLTDIDEAYSSDSKKEYFIGTTVVFNNNGTSELIDGQQRTTTLFLALCAFKSVFTEYGIDHATIDQCIANTTLDDDGNDVHKYHLLLQYEDASQILEQIANDNVPPEDSLTKSGKLLVAAYLRLRDFIATYCKEDPSEVKKFFMYFFRKIKFIQISTPDINDALKIFETVNDRGVGLNPMDLLKNLIFRQVGREKFDKLKDKWRELISILESNNEKPLRFLRYFIMSNFPQADQGTHGTGKNIIREDEIYKWMTDHTALCDYEKKPIDFVNLLIDNAKAFVYFSTGRDAKGQPNVYVKNINRLGGTVFRQHIIPLLTARNFSQDMFDYLARNIEAYLYYFLITKEQAKALEKNFAEWNLDLCTVSDLKGLNDFVAKHIAPEVAEKEIEYRDAFHRLSQSDLQVFRLRYVLAKLSQYVDLARQGIFTAQMLDSYFDTDIEHILPFTPESDEAKAKIDDYDRVKTMLGNLTLIEKPINRSIQNNSYSDKVEVYHKSKYYLTSSLKEVDVVGNNTAVNRIGKFLKAFSSWDKTSIEERQHILYNLSLEIWKIE